MKTANKILLAVNLLLMAAVFTGNYFFLTVGGSDIKALTSGGFVLMGLVNLIFAVAVKGSQVKYVATLAVGLMLACLGDILIGPSFVIGAALFALGHVCFFLAYCVLDRVRPLDLAIGGGIFAAAGSFVLFAPILRTIQVVLTPVVFSPLSFISCFRYSNAFRLIYLKQLIMDRMVTNKTVGDRYRSLI